MGPLPDGSGDGNTTASSIEHHTRTGRGMDNITSIGPRSCGNNPESAFSAVLADDHIAGLQVTVQAPRPWAWSIALQTSTNRLSSFRRAWERAPGSLLRVSSARNRVMAC